MGIRLVSSVAAAGNLDLPFPAHGQDIPTEANQTVAYSASGSMRTFIHGPERHQITRVWEALTDTEINRFMLWWKRHGRAGPPLVYRYQDFDDRGWRTLICRVAAPPKTVRVMKRMYDLTVVFEHDKFPDSATSTSVTVTTVTIGPPTFVSLTAALSGGL